MRFLTFLTVSLLAVLPATSQNLSGLSNFHQVNAKLFRGGQPSAAGMEQLHKLGVTTVVDLRESGERAEAEKKVVESLGMRYVNVPMRGMHTPEPGQVAKVLSIIDDNADGAVFVHCRRGADRTGAVVAIYRITHNGWDNGKALSEARALGMSRFQIALQHYVRDYRPERNAAISAPAGVPALVPAN
ncbi:MAG TPA: tyrosine-protein phosphatase [Bryobacteraceae bacterium]